MPFIQGGARVTSPGAMGNIATKKRLKELVHTTPHLVRFIPTSPFDRNKFSGTLDEFRAKGDKTTTLVVVGPDPETDRKWYANINLNANGQVKCS